MKKMLLLSVMLVLLITSRAQIMLEHTYPGSIALAELSISGYKYFMMDAVTNQCKIYNLDHSLWKTISLSVPSGLYLYDIKFVSETLFNMNNEVELAYIYYSYDTTNYYYTYYTKVINEFGYELLSVPGAGYLDLQPAEPNGAKLLAYVYNYAVYPSTVNTRVYSLPGSIPTGGIVSVQPKQERFPFPNPAGASVTIPYDLPEDVTTAQIQVFNSKGVVVGTYTIDRTFTTLMVPTDGLPGGLYVYQVRSGSEIISTGRFVHE